MSAVLAAPPSGRHPTGCATHSWLGLPSRWPPRRPLAGRWCCPSGRSWTCRTRDADRPPRYESSDDDRSSGPPTVRSWFAAACLREGDVMVVETGEGLMEVWDVPTLAPRRRSASAARARRRSARSARSVVVSASAGGRASRVASRSQGQAAQGEPPERPSPRGPTQQGQQGKKQGKAG